MMGLSLIHILYLADGKIEKIYTPQEFRSLSGATRKHMGLRTTDIQAVHPISYQRTFSRPILTVKDVSLFYKKHPVLEHISLQASKGDIIGVVGPNGAGKTTFLQMCIRDRSSTIKIFIEPPRFYVECI